MPARAPWWRPRWYAVAALLLCVAGVIAPAFWSTPASARAIPHSGPTVVSLTFDDGDSDQMRAAQLMAQYGMHGTFYIIPGAVGTPHYVTRDDLRELAAQGNEIGGHTVSHLDLQRVSLQEARRQVCGSRDILHQWGYPTRSFAYPNGAYNRPVERITRDCGYSSARTIVGLQAPGCPGCAVAETIPAHDPYAVRVPDEVDTSWTAGELEQTVLDATRVKGAWVPFVFHHVCEGGCGNLSVKPSVLAEFLQWLQLRQQFNLNVVQTVGDTLGGPVRPQVSTPPPPKHGVIYPGMERVGLSAVSSDQETLQESGLPACWSTGGYGSSKASWTRTPDAHSGRWAEQLTMTDHRSGDAKLLPRFDLGQCSISVRPNKDYILSSWYRSSGRAQYSAYYRNADGRWLYWTSSPFFGKSQHWKEAKWRAPPLPKDAQAISFGLAFSSNGWLVTDDYGIDTVQPYRDPTGPVGAGILLVAMIFTMRSRIKRRRANRPSPEPPAPQEQQLATAGTGKDGSA